MRKHKSDFISVKFPQQMILLREKITLHTQCKIIITVYHLYVGTLNTLRIINKQNIYHRYMSDREKYAHLPKYNAVFKLLPDQGWQHEKYCFS